MFPFKFLQQQLFVDYFIFVKVENPVFVLDEPGLSSSGIESDEGDGEGDEEVRIIVIFVYLMCWESQNSLIEDLIKAYFFPDSDQSF